ncbi:putative PurR-regulated permease PerM [Pedobacter sp. UYP30]|uniref:hypothetical protein n=1 Tax=Pedobacter sp. UYP30 TaxID=1756400 RepID=UPI00339746F4
MKKLIYTFALIFTLGISANSVSAAEKASKHPTELTTEQQAKLDKITTRVEEIREMDKSQLSRTEKRELRKELKEMKNQARAMSGGIYLSVGAIIIIIVVLLFIL